mmetsp:Transcript_130029/g.324083  ORF Transcript_130029/g.324083 Transcript_130029/m.324083 type:complete len:203 (-) Transcript_130029:41-649(-)
MGPPLPPGPLGHPFSPSEKPPKIVIELFHDLCCPFCKKMGQTLEKVMPSFEAKHPGVVQWLYMNVPQPWHAQSCLMHEACLAVSAVKPTATWPFIFALYEKQAEYYDAQVTDLSKRQLYQKLAELAASVGVPTEDVMGKLGLVEGENKGSQVTQLVKWYVKAHRIRSVHVTPTVFVNGIEAPQVQSGWSEDEWSEFLSGLVQ